MDIFLGRKAEKRGNQKGVETVSSTIIFQEKRENDISQRKRLKHNECKERDKNNPEKTPE